jgi:hypothetical protein
MQPGEFSKGTLIDVNEESGYDRRKGDIRKEVTLTKHFPLKDFSEVFLNIESMKDKMCGADPNLERIRHKNNAHTLPYDIQR